ncbi:MAG: hypothetical protein ACJ788_08795 [Ktedonobacteraceae bacterium]
MLIQLLQSVWLAPYYWHNLHFVMYARSMQGNKAQTLEAAKRLAAASGEMSADMPEMADGFNAFTTFVYARFGEWDAILKMRQPGHKMVASKSELSYARTLAFAAHEDRAAARREQAHFEQVRTSIPADALWGNQNNKAQDVMHVASEVLAARCPVISTRAVNTGSVQSTFRITLDMTSHRRGITRYESRSALVFCASEKQRRAVQVFHEGVRRSPRNGRMLFGLTESLRAEGKSSEAESVKREFDAAWSGADVHLRVEDL